MSLRVDKRVRHMTLANVTRMLARKRITHYVLRTGADNAMVTAVAPLPTQRALLEVLAFSFSAKYGYFYRTWKGGE